MISMANIIDIVNQIGSEVSDVLENNKTSLYFQEISLLCSLTENLLKYLVATKDCWDAVCNRVDKTIEQEKKTKRKCKDTDLDVDFRLIRKLSKDLDFYSAINRACSLGLISNDLKIKLHKFRKDRNDLLHELYLFEKRNDTVYMRNRLLECENIVMELVPVFENLIFEEIGVDTPEVLETL